MTAQCGAVASEGAESSRTANADYAGSEAVRLTVDLDAQCYRLNWLDRLSMSRQNASRLACNVDDIELGR